MTYIANFDPEWHAADPDKDIPFTCVWCGWQGTREDTATAVIKKTGLIGRECPNCDGIVWDYLDPC